LAAIYCRLALADRFMLYGRVMRVEDLRCAESDVGGAGKEVPRSLSTVSNGSTAKGQGVFADNKPLASSMPDFPPSTIGGLPEILC
jgi:hypothetical protein